MKAPGRMKRPPGRAGSPRERATTQAGACRPAHQAQLWVQAKTQVFQVRGFAKVSDRKRMQAAGQGAQGSQGKAGSQSGLGEAVPTWGAQVPPRPGVRI